MRVSVDLEGDWFEAFVGTVDLGREILGLF